MSNEEKKRREQHQAYRKKWIRIQLLTIALFAICFIFTLFAYNKSKEQIYIEYNEYSEVDYNVYLKDNEFYENNYLEKDQAYITTLIDNIVAEFNYKICLNDNNANFNYSYSIDAQLEIFDNEFKKPIYNPIEVLVDKQIRTLENSNKLEIKDQVNIDYNKYTTKAENFIKAYDLSNVDSCLIVRMHINVISVCDKLEGNAADDYTISLTIPLTKKTTEVTFESSVPTAEKKMLACSNAAKHTKTYKTMAIIIAILEVLFVITLAAFMFVTYDKHVDYSSKVAKILRNFKSYIQKINNEFDDKDYQILCVDTFNEMLDIRDTLQRPILFFENEDKTCAKFCIFTDTMIMYLYKIEVSMYD